MRPALVARVIGVKFSITGVLALYSIFTPRLLKKFKKDSGARKFYAFRYHQHFKDYIQADKDKETKDLERDVRSHYDSIKWRADSIQNMSEEDVKSLFINHIEKMRDYQKRYDDLSRYDYFAGSLKNDWYFNAEIQKDIDKYI